jgi:hypothetical protein
MSRASASLHYALAVDREIFDASRVDPALLDPIVRIEGGVPGVARPFVVLRDYQGPQGAYIEQFVLRDAQGGEVMRSDVRRIELNGQMFTDRFTTTLSNVPISDADEHELTFYVNDHPAGTIPVFLEAGLGGDAWVAAKETFARALKKGTILWLTVPQPDGREHSQAVWFVFTDDKLYVVNGPGEQQVPNLDAADRVWVTVRSKDDRSQVSRLPATVRALAPDDPQFEKAGRAGLGRRLNLSDGDAALERWRQTCVMYELAPRFGDEAKRRAAAGTAPAATAPGGPETAAAPAAGTPKEAEIHVEAQVDQETFDKLIAEGKPERVARAKAKAAFVRKEKARIRAEQEAGAA